jgi:hypothetical protein
MKKGNVANELVTVQDVVICRGERVMLDARVAEAFGTETRQVNQAVVRNRNKFSDAHCFQLAADEFRDLISQSVMSKSNRGGRRYAPRVFTVKGVARLATVLSTPAALRATDLIIDTFLVVQEQLSAGQRNVAIPSPDRYRAAIEDQAEIRKLRKRGLKAARYDG